jgi:hypothetical protein
MFARFKCGAAGPLSEFGKTGCGHEYVAEVPPIYCNLPRCPKCNCWRAWLVEALLPVAG